jgi:hypothetical protein
MAGVSAQEQVGDGHALIVGKGGGLWRIEEYRMAERLDDRHTDLVIGLRNMAKKRKEMRLVGSKENEVERMTMTFGRLSTPEIISR